MDTLASADGKMVGAMGANLLVFIQFLVENHGGALRALLPYTLGNIPPLGFARGELGLFGKSRVPGGGGINARFEGFQTEEFFREGCSSHVQEGAENQFQFTSDMARRAQSPANPDLFAFTTNFILSFKPLIFKFHGQLSRHKRRLLPRRGAPRRRHWRSRRW
jgi:hypothetical protein